MAMVHRHGSGKHKRTVLGINLLTLLWTAGGTKLPIDCWLSNVPMYGIDKNQHSQDMLDTAQERDFAPAYVCLDSWYSGLDNLKPSRKHGWVWLTCLKSNRAVDPIYLLSIPPAALIVHLRGYGLIKVFVGVAS